MRALRQVVSNKGSAGVDGMPVAALRAHLTTNRERIESALRRGTYLPQAILGVAIPKSSGKTRLLGIPTATDRLLQQAVGQAIAIKFEVEFEDYSYGFRPNRNAVEQDSPGLPRRAATLGDKTGKRANPERVP